MTLFAFRGVKSHGWTFCDPIKGGPYGLCVGGGNLDTRWLITVRAILLLIFFSTLIWALKGLFSSGKARKFARGASSAGEEMVKDPVCGVYVPLSSSVRKIADGRTVYFCSEKCKDSYK